MDWGICTYVDLQGRKRKVACFVMVLGFSRVRYIEFSKRSDLHSLLRCIVHAFKYFGGVPQVLLTDRMKTVILQMDQGKATWQAACTRQIHWKLQIDGWSGGSFFPSIADHFSLGGGGQFETGVDRNGIQSIWLGQNQAVL